MHKIKIKKDGKHLFGSIGGEVVVIFQENELTKLISMHFRASIFPNESALISSLLIPAVKNMKFGDNFEITDDGRWLFGEKALKYAADNMSFLWFGSFDEHDKEEVLKAMEESKNIDKNLLN